MRLVWAVQSAALAVIAGAILFAIDLVWLPLPDPLPAGAALVLALFGVVSAVLRYRFWRYEIREDSIYLERGVFTRVRTVIPYVRIQHVDSSRRPVERAFGLASAVVYTAGSRGADVSIPGLTPQGADDLRERLKRLAIRAEGEDAV